MTRRREEPPYYYVREKSSAVAHVWDYFRNRSHRALCGHPYEDPIELGEVERPRAVCRACQDLLPKYELIWWRDRAERIATELDDLNAENDRLAWETAVNLEAARAKYDKLIAEAARERAAARAKNDNQRNEIRHLRQALQQAKRQIANKPTRALSPRITEKPKKKGSRQPPPVRVVSGGLPGHGRRR